MPRGASAFLKHLKAGAGPLVITQNGRPAEAYDRMQERQQYLEAVAAGLSDAVAGRVAEWLATWGTEPEGDPPL